MNTFCDEQGWGLIHNDQIPNEQNNLCGGKSVWSVIQQHPDMKNRATQTVKQMGMLPYTPLQ